MTHVDARSEFVINRKFGPCRVSKDLLLRLEGDLLPALRAIVGDIDTVKFEESVKIELTDEFGQETVSSADQLVGSKFPDSIEKVNLQISVVAMVRDGPEIITRYYLRTNFDFTSPSGCSFRIAFSSPRARDQAMGIEARVHRLLDDALMAKGLFYLPSPWSGIVRGLTVLICTVFVFASISGFGNSKVFVDPTYQGIGLAAVSLFLYQIIRERFFPWCQFDTKQRDDLENWKSWAKYGLASLLVFDLALVAFGRYIRAVVGF